MITSRENADASPASSHRGWQSVAIMAIAVAVASVATGAAFAGWSHHGGDIVATLIATGLSWCM
jgi:1,4-dihydroxy-2-naphthoate octaprenyltransferase